VVRSLAAPQARAAIGGTGSPSGHAETMLVVEREAQVRTLTP
jgi:hypothetical protein